MAYLPGRLTRVRVRAVGSLEGFSSSTLHAAHTPGRASAPEGSTRYQTLHGYITRCPVIADALYEHHYDGSSKRGLNLLAVYSCRRHLSWPFPQGMLYGATA